MTSRDSTKRDQLAGRIAIYARISKEERQYVRPGAGNGAHHGEDEGEDGAKPAVAEDEGNGGSTSSQIYRCKQHLMAHYPRDVVDTARIYRDEGYSGSTTDRPDFQKMMRDIRHGRIKVVVFSEASRISRSLRDLLYLVDEFTRFGAEFISLREQFDTTSPQGRLLIHIFAALNQFEREQTAVRTHLNMRARADQGYWTGGTVPLGYEIDPDRRGHLRVVEDEARIIRTLFDVYQETGSVPETVGRLKELGCQMPEWTSTRGQHHAAKPVLWDTVRHALSNPTYVGLREVNRKHKNLDEAALADLPKEEHYHLVKGAWLPIIDQVTYDKVQALVAENDRRNRNIQMVKVHDFVLTGLVFCADCGTALEGASGKNHTFFYYRHPRKYDCSKCSKKSWTAVDVEQAAIAKLSRLADDEDLLAMVINEANARLAQSAPVREGELVAAKQKVSRLEANVASLMEKLKSAASKVPESFWDMANAQEVELKNARVSVTGLEVELADLKAKRLHAATYREALRRFGQLYAGMTPFDKSQILAYLIERIELGKEGATMWLLGENPTTEVLGSTNENRPHSLGYCEGGEWLRL